MNIPGIKGSSTAKGYQGWIELDSLEYGSVREIKLIVGRAKNREMSLPKVGEFAITKEIDAATPKLIQASCSGNSMGPVVIHCCKTGKQGLKPYLKFILSNVMISYYDTGGTSGHKLEENLGLNFTKVEVQFIGYASDGSVENPIAASYDIAKIEVA